MNTKKVKCKRKATKLVVRKKAWIHTNQNALKMLYHKDMTKY